MEMPAKVFNTEGREKFCVDFQGKLRISILPHKLINFCGGGLNEWEWRVL